MSNTISSLFIIDNESKKDLGSIVDEKIVAELSSTKESLTAKIDEVSTVASRAQTNSNANAESITAIKTDVSAHTEKLTSLETSLATANTTIGEHTTKLTNLESADTEITTKVTDAVARITTLEKNPSTSLPPIGADVVVYCTSSSPAVTYGGGTWKIVYSY